MCFVSQLSRHFLAERFFNQSVQCVAAAAGCLFLLGGENGENGPDVFQVAVRLPTVGKRTTFNMLHLETRIEGPLSE